MKAITSKEQFPKVKLQTVIIMFLITFLILVLGKIYQLYFRRPTTIEGLDVQGTEDEDVDVDNKAPFTYTDKEGFTLTSKPTPNSSATENTNYSEINKNSN